jgi:hypothetical protein
VVEAAADADRAGYLSAAPPFAFLFSFVVDATPKFGDLIVLPLVKVTFLANLVSLWQSRLPRFTIAQGCGLIRRKNVPPYLTAAVRMFRGYVVVPTVIVIIIHIVLLSHCVSLRLVVATTTKFHR